MIEHNQQSLLLGKIAAYTEILVKDPSSTIFISLAETYRKMGMFDDARQIISRGLDLHPDVSPAYIVLARVLCQLEDFSGSVVAFEKALELDQENLAALVGYARVQILLGDEVVARELLLRARALSSADPVINKLLLSLPEVQIAAESSPADLAHSDEVEEDSSPLVSSTLAELYLVQGLTAKALDLFQRLSALNPDDLFFRRKVKELEAQLDEENQHGTKTADEVESDLDEPAQVVVTDSVVEIAIPLQQSEDAVTEMAVSASDNSLSINTPLMTLNRWLSNIQQRRGNV